MASRRRRFVIQVGLTLLVVAVSAVGVLPVFAAAAVPWTSAAPATDCAQTTLASLTTAQRVGQLFIIGFGARLEPAERDAIATWHFGSVTYSATTSAGRAAVRRTTDAIHALATSAATGSVGLLVAANQEGGYVQALRGPGFDAIPTALAQGRLAPAELQSDATTWGRQLRRAGVDLDFAPVADVVPAGTSDQNAPIGQLQREFGHTPAAVANHVVAFIDGMDQAGELTTVKHFPGLGRVRGNTDVTAAVTDTVTTRDDPFLRPFRQAIAAGVPFVMVSLATYTRIDPGHLAAFSRTILRGMLRGDMGFDGVIVSDDLSAVAVRSIPAGDRAIAFLKAGGDLLTVTSLSDARAMAATLTLRANARPAFRDRIDQSVLRILQAKESAGLLAC